MKITLDTDTRQVRLRDGAYRSGAGKRICDHCGHRATCRLVDQVSQCADFLPALPFTDETGLQKVSNTMRVGRAWTERLQIGQTVALYHTKRREVFGYAQVLHHSYGPIVPMLRLHAGANHLMLDTPLKKAPKVLGEWMRQNYGPRIINGDTTLTAVYLLRVSQPPAAPNLEGLEAPGSGGSLPAGEGEAGRE